jgi:hypothetical protein
MAAPSRGHGTCAQAQKSGPARIEPAVGFSLTSIHPYAGTQEAQSAGSLRRRYHLSWRALR